MKEEVSQVVADRFDDIAHYLAKSLGVRTKVLGIKPTEFADGIATHVLGEIEFCTATGIEFPMGTIKVRLDVANDTGKAVSASFKVFETEIVDWRFNGFDGYERKKS